MKTKPHATRTKAALVKATKAWLRLPLADREAAAASLQANFNRFLGMPKEMHGWGRKADVALGRFTMAALQLLTEAAEKPKST